MDISKVSRKGGILYLVSLKPEQFALSLYALILSLLAANWLWLNVLYLCSTMEVIDVKQLVSELLSIHFFFAVATIFVWWRLLQENGRSVLTHVMFFVWQGSKLFAAALEVCSFKRFYEKLVHNIPKEVVPQIALQMGIGLLVIGGLEVYGLFLANRYLRQKKPKGMKPQRAYTGTTMTV